MYELLANIVLLLHLTFIVLVVFGIFLVLWWPRLAWVHIPAVLWGAAITVTGKICPLTPLENRLRLRSGNDGYQGGFIDHYVMPIIYPPGLTREMQVAMGVVLLALNIAIYAWIWRKRRRRG